MLDTISWERLSHRYRHLKKIAKKQWQSGQPVKGEHSNQQLWRHVDRLNADAADRVAGEKPVEGHPPAHMSSRT